MDQPDKPPLFVGIAQRYGFSGEVAQTVLDRIGMQLSLRGYARHTVFYVYRTDKPAAGTGGSAGRARLLLAFPSADAALSFAQHSGLGVTPRLLAMNVSQLLSVLLQRPAISALLFATETEAPSANSLPCGFRLERTTLLELLQGG